MVAEQAEEDRVPRDRDLVEIEGLRGRARGRSDEMESGRRWVSETDSMRVGLPRCAAWMEDMLK